MKIDQSVTSNMVSIRKNLNAMQKYAVMGFLFGYDNYCEEVIGVTETPEYHEKENYYSMVVQLRESETHNSTSGIGFYVDEEKNTMMIYSCHAVMTVIITKEILEQLHKAKPQ